MGTLHSSGLRFTGLPLRDAGLPSAAALCFAGCPGDLAALGSADACSMLANGDACSPGSSCKAGPCNKVAILALQECLCVPNHYAAAHGCNFRKIIIYIAEAYELGQLQCIPPRTKVDCVDQTLTNLICSGGRRRCVRSRRRSTGVRRGARAAAPFKTIVRAHKLVCDELSLVHRQRPVAARREQRAAAGHAAVAPCAAVDPAHIYWFTSESWTILGSSQRFCQPSMFSSTRMSAVMSWAVSAAACPEDQDS